eukprot:CAMPEP_0174737862 /NCGR_PEP_ID=MMETSP1094-20130205/68964_1 /TAXON_ID=156173 /ORGANISM="Chrysochromulina brevifilum, Strain UTEX LB 985" /LENGTH=106 /DNA_ID=CAMNT_0015941153 /DNA_START=250 /DNA_END=570 /DNA_ORIENTATION=+
MTFLLCEIGRRLAPVVSPVRIVEVTPLILHEHLSVHHQGKQSKGGLLVRVVRAVVQRCVANRRPGAQVCTTLNQRIDHSCVPGLSGDVKRRHGTEVLCMVPGSSRD